MYNYTFIIPHKNSPELLYRWLESIPSRDDIQIIIVDDNSDPKIVNQDNFPFKIRKNVEVIFNKYSKGAGYARNLGLQLAIGKRQLFPDADDFYVDGFIDILDNKVNSDNDIIYFDVFSYENNKKCKHVYINSIFENYYIISYNNINTI